MPCGFVLKAAHLLKLRNLKNKTDKGRKEAEAHEAELAASSAAHAARSDENREDIEQTETDIADLKESWRIMRDMYDTSKRMKKMRETSLVRKVAARFMHRTAVICLKEWNALTQRRKRQRFAHEWQTKLEDAEFEEQSMKKALIEAKNKLHFVQNKSQAERVKALIARMGFRSLGMWMLMWRDFVKVSQKERRAEAETGLHTEIREARERAATLSAKIHDQAGADDRMSQDVEALVQHDSARHETVLPVVLKAVEVAARIGRRHVVKFPAGSRTNGLHAHMRTLEHSGTALEQSGSIAHESAISALIKAEGSAEGEPLLPPVAGAQPLSPLTKPAPPAAPPPKPPPSPPLTHVKSAMEELVGVDEEIQAEDVPAESLGKAHQRSRPFSRGRTIVEPGEHTKAIARGDLSLPVGGRTRGSTRKRLATVGADTGSGKLDSPRAARLVSA